MDEKNLHGFQGPPNASPPPYSAEPPPGYPVGIVMPGMAPGQAHPQPVQQVSQQYGQNIQANGQSPPVIIYANMTSPFGPYPQRVFCPHCRTHVTTETRTRPGLLTYILSGTLLVLTWYLLCCFVIPFCISECQDIQHICPNRHCKKELGLYKRI